MINDLEVLEQFGGVETNSLCHLLNNHIDNNNNAINDDHVAEESGVIRHSSYHDDTSLSNLFQCKGNVFSILSLNSQSLNAKFDQINIKLQELTGNGNAFSALCLQETWLFDDSDTSMLNINGYTLIFQGKICSTHGGLAIYLSTKFSFKTLTVYENSEIWEGQFIEITGNETNKSIILGNIYRPPSNTSIICQSFIDNFVSLLETLRRKNREVIIAGDYNIDLLKIDNLKYKHSDNRGIIRIQKWDVRCVHKFNIELNKASIYELMNTTIDADPNANLNILNRIISQAKDKHLPLRYVKYDKHKHKKSLWITNGILRSLTFRDKLYLQLKRPPAGSDQHTVLKMNLNTYSNYI